MGVDTMLNTIITSIFLFIFFLPFFCIGFFIITLIRDLTRNFNNIKVTYNTSTYYETGKTILELRYFIWERRKRKYFIDLVEQSEIIYLKGNKQIVRGMYYVDASPLKGNNKKSFLRKCIQIFEK